MNDFKEMTMEEWEATYKPIYNHIDKNASFQNDSGQGIMFETYGDELEFVKSANPLCVWTYGDGDDGGSYIWNGYHYINRQGYFITEVPAPTEEECIIQIKVSSYWYYCEGCGEEMEDDGQLINERYYEYERCPICITEEEMLELEKQEENPMDKNTEVEVEVTEEEETVFHNIGGERVFKL